MALVTRARIAGILAICVLMLGAPGALANGVNHDAEIRLGSGSYVGGGIINPDAAGQAVTNTGVIDQKVTFFIKITNGVAGVGSFKVKRSGFFDDGYRVRYYDALNNDVTGRVNAGTFTTPLLPLATAYEMRATVKIRSQATECSQVTRLIIVSSTGNPAAKDAVRFTAALDTPDVNCSPVARDDTNSVTEDAPGCVAGNLLANDTDPDGGTLQIESFYSPAYATGSFEPFSNGNYCYTLDNLIPEVNYLNYGETLVDSIDYTISDGDAGPYVGTHYIGTLYITIHGVTD